MIKCHHKDSAQYVYASVVSVSECEKRRGPAGNTCLRRVGGDCSQVGTVWARLPDFLTCQEKMEIWISKQNTRV
jgi:hypothetical protein